MLKRISGMALLGNLIFAATANAGPVSETLYYTTFAGGQDVWKVTGTYTGNGTAGNGTFSLTGDTLIASTPAADGIVFNPNNGQLLVGGETSTIHQVNPGTGLFTTVATGRNTFELAVDPSKNFVWGGGKENGTTDLTKTPINPFGGAGTVLTLAGATTSITHLTFAPNLAANTAYYTASNNDGTSPTFGTVNLTTGVTTSITLGGVVVADRWHGMDYDPFTGDLILVGGDEILQVDPLTNTILSRLHLGHGEAFDQGAVDGLGHVFWADNFGRMLFIDYSTTLLVGSVANFVSDNFFKSSLDDIAPLIGAGGSNNQGVPEPASLILLGAGLLGMRILRRKSATA